MADDGTSDARDLDEDGGDELEQLEQLSDGELPEKVEEWSDPDEDEDTNGDTKQKGGGGKTKRYPRSRMVKPPPRDDLISDDEDSGDERQREEIQARLTKRQFKTVRQSKRDLEREMFKNRRNMNETKRKNTLIRACKPKPRKHNYVEAEKKEEANAAAMAQTARFVRPSPEESYEARKAELNAEYDAACDDEDEDKQMENRARIEQQQRTCTSNYHNWAYGKATTTKAILCNESAPSASSVSSSASSASVASAAGETKKRTLGDFFKKAPGATEKRITRFYDIIYHFDVLPSVDALVTIPHFETMEDLNDVFSDRFPNLVGNHYKDLKKAKKRKEASVAKQELVTPMCPDCNLELVEDTKEASATCPGCGVSRRGAYSFKVTYSDIQSSSKGAAPYMRIAHVSLFIRLIWLFI